MEAEWPQVAERSSQIFPRPFTRSAPVGVTMPATTHILAFEDIREIIENAKTLAVTKCTCRLTAHKCNKELEACLQINRAADYSLTRGTGRRLSKEEALDLVHCVRNVRRQVLLWRHQSGRRGNGDSRHRQVPWMWSVSGFLPDGSYFHD